MKYISEIDDDFGFCPECGSSDTILVTSKTKRACLKCEFSEEFEDYPRALLAWRSKAKVPQKSIAEGDANDTIDTGEASKACPSGRVKAEVDKIIEVVESRVTRITIPTSYRESFNEFLKERNVGQECPFKTDVWNNVESAYTMFVVLTSRSSVDQLFEEWTSKLN